MNRLVAAGLFWLLPATALAQTWRMGPTLGASLLTQHDTSLSHASLVDEVTVGPTVLFGLGVEVAFDSGDRVGLELVLGPYHNDVDRFCINRVPGDPPCVPEPDRSVSRALLWGVQYAHRFGGGPWRPYLAGGFGVRTQWWEREMVPDFDERKSRAIVDLALGAELANRKPFRLEARGQLNLSNPHFVPEKTHLELQIRAAFLLPLH